MAGTKSKKMKMCGQDRNARSETQKWKWYRSRKLRDSTNMRYLKISNTFELVLEDSNKYEGQTNANKNEFPACWKLRHQFCPETSDKLSGNPNRLQARISS